MGFEAFWRPSWEFRSLHDSTYSHDTYCGKNPLVGLGWDKWLASEEDTSVINVRTRLVAHPPSVTEHAGDEITSKTTPNHDENRPIIGDSSHQQGMFPYEFRFRLGVGRSHFQPGWHQPGWHQLGAMPWDPSVRLKMQPRNNVQSEPYGADLPIPRSCSKSLPPHPLPGIREKKTSWKVEEVEKWRKCWCEKWEMAMLIECAYSYRIW